MIDALPELPSALIRLALKDLGVCEGDPLYIVDMGAWVHRGDSTCTVCLAGAVMVQSLGCGDETYPSDFDSAISKKLHALNLFREGDVLDGVSRMGLDYMKLPTSLRYISVVSYTHSHAGFKESLSKLADSLEACGL